ncbi:hypothetical protein CRYUN_Cryun13aG0118200 [Craigia yunnanensis]
MMGVKSPRFLPKNMRCPPGSVLIKRTTKEDLIMAKKIKALGMNYPTSSSFHSTGAAPGLSVSSTCEYTKHNFGAKATINVWNPSVSTSQYSFANIWISNGPAETANVIQAGWGVLPILFSSNYTRLLAHWTVSFSTLISLNSLFLVYANIICALVFIQQGYKKTGCFNYLCPGFVQVSSEISLGLVLNQISTYNGTQKEIEIGVVKDGEWWLMFYNKFVGYWPQSLFTYMYGGGNFVVWGGQVFSPLNEPSPAMGSGHFPKYGYERKSAYFKQLRIWDDQHFVSPDGNFLQMSSNRPDCYEAEVTNEGAAPYPMALFYGGPGQCKFSAVLEYKGVHFGSKANINVWSLGVSDDQLSTANVWIIKGVPPKFSIYRQAGLFISTYIRTTACYIPTGL